MKFPSVKSLVQSTGNTAKRFPFELLFAVAGTIAATVNIELEDINRIGENWCLRVIMIANLGLLLSLCASLYTESFNSKPAKKLLIRLVVVCIVILLLFLINPGLHQADYIRFFLLSFALHLFVAFAAFTSKGCIQGFWQFNKTLFLRFLTAALYGIVLFLGLSAAIGAMNYLFNLKFEWDTFAILFVWIVGVFSTTFFLSGVPKEVKALNEDYSYPRSLKIFTQYVLIPLASVYVIILLAYEIKILIEWNLPKGAVSSLILSYAVFGILSLLLVYPVREKEENKWLKTYTRSFYFLMIPLLILLFAAAGIRIAAYGITEYRYFLITLACWLLFITIYFLFFKKHNIKLIPISLSIITALSVYGPQSAFSVSLLSQKHILVNIFKRNDAYRNGKLLSIKKISRKDGQQAAAILNYLLVQHDLLSLQPYFDKDLDEVSDSISKQKDKYNPGFLIANYQLREEKLNWVQKQLGLSKYSGYYADTTNVSENFYHFQMADDILTIKRYDYFIDAKGYNDTTVTLYKGIKFTEQKSSDQDYTLIINNEIASFNLRPLAKKLLLSKNKFEKIKQDITSNMLKYSVPDDSLMISTATKHYIIVLAVNNLEFKQLTEGDIDITYANANYLIKEK